jgi:hypothetical protein
VEGLKVVASGKELASTGEKAPTAICFTAIIDITSVKKESSQLESDTRHTSRISFATKTPGTYTAISASSMDAKVPY